MSVLWVWLQDRRKTEGDSLGNRKPWRVWHQYRENGQTKTRRESFASEEAAKRRKEELIAQKVRRDFVPTDRSRVTVCELAEGWIETKRDLKPKTYYGYRNILHSRVLPVFGDTPVGDLEPKDVDKFLGDLGAAHLSSSRIRNSYNVLKQVLDYAVRNGNVRQNPAAVVSAPTVRTGERVFLNATQVDALADAIDPQFRALVYVLSYGGLRWGEAAGLRRKRCNVLRGELHVAETVAEFGGQLVFGTPKDHQQRTVHLPDSVRQELARHLAEHTADDPDSLVFGESATEPIPHSVFLRREFRPAVKAAEVPEVTPHGLRHSCASLWREAGARVEEVQRQLGHENAYITLKIYSHLFAERPSGVLGNLDTLRAAGSDDAGLAPDLPQEGSGRVIDFPDERAGGE